MKDIIRYELNYASVKDYIQNSLEETNTLSSEFFKLTNFNKGKFFTFLPDKLNKDDVIQFKLGGIAYGVREFIISYIIDQIQSNHSLSCIFDDVGASYYTGYNDPLYFELGSFYKNEIYYFVSAQKANRGILKRCLHASNAIWHSLCLLTENCSLQKKLEKQDILTSCQHSKIMILGAYDGEGYIIWEKNP